MPTCFTFYIPFPPLCLKKLPSFLPADKAKIIDEEAILRWEEKPSGVYGHQVLDKLPKLAQKCNMHLSKLPNVFVQIAKKYLSLGSSGEKPWGFRLTTHTMPLGGETMLNEANIKFSRLQKHLYIWPNEGTSRIKCRHRNIYNGIHGNLSVSQHFSINLVCSRGTLPQVAPVLTKYKNRGIGALWSPTRV